jgi:hypothetical protein
MDATLESVCAADVQMEAPKPERRRKQTVSVEWALAFMGAWEEIEPRASDGQITS